MLADIIDDRKSADLIIENPPHSSHNAKLVEDFSSQLQHLVAGRHDSSIQQLTQLQVRFFRSWKESEACLHTKISRA